MPDTTLTSRRHPLVARCRDAADGSSDEVLLDGPHLVADALAAGTPLHAILVGEGAERRPEIARLVTSAHVAGVVVQLVTAAVLDAASPTRTPSGVVALAHLALAEVAAVIVPPPALVTVAVGVQDPGNLGTLVRSSEAAGATGVLALGASAHPLGWRALRGSMGSALRLPIARRADTEAALAELRDAGVRLVALSTDGADATLGDVDLRGPVAICAGAEGTGLPSAALALADVRLRIPMRPPVESLNVGVAASLVLFEAMRQRAGAGQPASAAGPGEPRR